MSRNQTKHSRILFEGFTLVELLVVICIIATLSAILIPAANGAHRRAQQAVCLGNIRTVGNAVLSMVADQGNFTGRSAAGFADPGFATGNIMQYLVAANKTKGGSTKMPRCPLIQTNGNGGNYSVNAYLSLWQNLSSVPAPLSRTILVSECSYSAYMYNVAMEMEMTETMWGLAYNGSSPPADAKYAVLKALEGKDYTPQYHGDPTNRGLNMFMVDGSATLVTSGVNCNFYYAPSHASVSNGIVLPGGYVWDQWYWITNNATYIFPTQ
ncbi:MAG: prepilin-type N-terminal cleavage/methylation domain-containing protein [Chthoniobacterales bacterium]